MALLCTPIGFIVALGVGEGIMSALGYEPGTDDPPLLQDLLISVAAFIPFAVAPGLSLYWGLRALRGRARGALLAVVVSTLLLVGFGGLLLATAIAD